MQCRQHGIGENQEYFYGAMNLNLQVPDAKLTSNFASIQDEFRKMRQGPLYLSQNSETNNTSLESPDMQLFESEMKTGAAKYITEEATPNCTITRKVAIFPKSHTSRNFDGNNRYIIEKP